MVVHTPELAGVMAEKAVVLATPLEAVAVVVVAQAVILVRAVMVSKKDKVGAPEEVVAAGLVAVDQL